MSRQYFDVQSMDTQIGKDTEIGVSVQCYGKVEIGPNCRIEGPTWIRDSTLEEGAHVRSHSVLEETHVEKNAGIGPFACLGGGLHIGTNAKIGSFVRAANAIVGNDSLAHPLAAIEDVEVWPTHTAVTRITHYPGLSQSLLGVSSKLIQVA